MWGAAGLGWRVAASAAVCVASAVATIALLPPLQRRLRHPAVASKVPFAAYLAFDLSVRLRAFLHGQGGVSSKLTKISDVDVLAPGVIRVLGKNPGRMTLQGTNTYLLGEGPRRILIDASDGNLQYVHNLLRVCEAHGVQEITDLVITHGHSDHIGGVMHVREAFPGVRTWKYMPTGGADRQLRYSNAQCETLLIQPLAHGKSFRVPGTEAVLRTEYMPGHCADHVCFFLEDKSATMVALFSGDCILGEGSCVFDSLKDLVASLQRLRALAPQIIFPAHGPVIMNPSVKIDEYITHRQKREYEILAVLRSKDSPLSSKELVEHIYEKLPFLLQFAARKAVDKHLEKLLHEKLVIKTPTSWCASAKYQLIASS